MPRAGLKPGTDDPELYVPFKIGHTPKDSCGQIVDITA
jgi:hypothetical protein